MVDALDLKFSSFMSVGSSPIAGIKCTIFSFMPQIDKVTFLTTVY